MSRFRHDISKPLLQKLYHRQKLSSVAIAKRFSCAPTTILNHLRSFGLSVRTLRDASRYKTFSTFPGRITYPKRDFDGDQARKAYLIGFRLGDLPVRPVCGGSYSQTLEISSRSTRPEQLQLFKQLFDGYGHLYESRPDRHGAVGQIHYVNRSFDFLLPKQDAVEQWIRDDARCAVAFAAGYIDAEGSFHIVQTKTGLRKAVFALASQDRRILHWCHDWFQRVGVRCQPPKLAIPQGTPRTFSLNRDYWILQVHRKDALAQLVALLKPWIQHGKRAADMALVLNNIRERNHSPRLKLASHQHRLAMTQLTL